MLDKNKQIEEIKRVLIKTCKRCRTFEEDYMQSKYAEAIYNAGYRKQNVTVKEILQRLYDRTKSHYGDKIILTSDNIKELAAQYGVEVEE